MLQANLLTKYYSGTKVLKSISFETRASEVFGIVGPNGAGKSTLLRILAGILCADEGEVLLDGHPLSLSASSAWGYLPEERGLYANMKVVDQLVHWAALKGCERLQAREKALVFLKTWQMEKYAGRMTGELSKGNQQRIQYLSAILHDPQLIILDEPFSGLDPIQTDWLKEQLLAFKAQGKTVIYSSHRMESVEELCDRVLLLHEGEVLRNGSLEEWRLEQQEVWELVLETLEVPQLPPGMSVTEQKIQNGKVNLRFTCEGSSLSGMLRELENQGVVLESVRRYRPGLQELFIRYTAVKDA